METAAIVKLVQQYSYQHMNEQQLQDTLELLFSTHDVPFVREATLMEGRIDFLCGDVGVEVKVKGSYPAVLRQLSQYGKDPQVKHLVLISSAAQHRRFSQLETLNSKPFTFVPATSTRF